ncbi:hypothetical protein UA08_00194 [Talaromyces atroroseus]|uniref:NmrA-like domain-containing protein n=1 Tax=Talaromyces atroroseus TaxID=1441469 RepID=A0A225BAM9_TALAT|nr:hypothetical protein UA08_00194 [Talaromyces atroroseus]OKL64446.1 hypothetical protein UA08_00194 [Talaromyces atroroseus]
MPRLVTVFGATGQQGGSVIHAILQDETLSKEFKTRGVSRDTSKPPAQTLIRQGVELVSADLNSKESLTKVIAGSDSVFLVTTPAWGIEGSDAELVHGKNVADVVKETGVQHFIFSSLLNITKEFGGRLKHVPYFDQKAQVEHNYTQFGMLRKGDDGVYTLTCPVSKDTRFPLIDITNDLGKFVAAILKNRSEALGAQVLAATDYYTPTRLLAELEEVTRKKTRFVQVDSETYKSFKPGPIGEEMLENHLFIESPGYYAGRSLNESHDLLKKAGYQTTSWKAYLEQNKSSLDSCFFKKGAQFSRDSGE